jgi:transcriptional regulator with XRE-family HTH domain
MAENKRQTKAKAMINDLYLAEKVTSARLQAGLTQRDLAKAMQTSQPVVARWETGRATPNITTLDRLAEVTGLRLEIRLV